jgi:hypothetical protein
MNDVNKLRVICGARWTSQSEPELGDRAADGVLAIPRCEHQLRQFDGADGLPSRFLVGFQEHRALRVDLCVNQAAFTQGSES